MSHKHVWTKVSERWGDPSELPASEGPFTYHKCLSLAASHRGCKAQAIRNKEGKIVDYSRPVGGKHYTHTPESEERFLQALKYDSHTNGKLLSERLRGVVNHGRH